MRRKTTYPNVLISFIRSEGTTVSEEIDEANSDTTIDVKDELSEIDNQDQSSVVRNIHVNLQYPSSKW